MDSTIRQYSLRELRARLGETQRETAKALGVSVQAYNKWEKDFSKVKISRAVALAEHFGVTLDELLIP